MSSTSSVALAASLSDLNEPECEPLPSVSSIPTADPSSESTGPVCPASMTSEPLESESSNVSEESTWFAGASLAKTSVALAVVPGWKASVADSGLKCSESFAWLNPDGSWVKIHQRSLFEGSLEYSRTWPMQGMTRNGVAFLLPLSVPTTYELASGFLPTPVASETGFRRKPYSQGGLSLSTVIGGRPNPEFVEWLMGFPPKWTDLEHSETPSSPKSRSSSAGASKKRKKGSTHDK
jgi:hypothetical protein